MGRTKRLRKYKAGWWYTNPSEKNESVHWDDDIPEIYGKESMHVPVTTSYSSPSQLQRIFHSWETLLCSSKYLQTAPHSIGNVIICEYNPDHPCMVYLPT